MKRLYLLLTLFAAAGCDAGHEAAAPKPRPDCTAIVSDVERLACFDTAAGTPPAPANSQATASTPTTTVPVATGSPSVQASQADIKALVSQNEAGRTKDNRRFLLSRSEDVSTGQERVVISAPALGETSQARLAISCLSNISRLQLLTDRPIDPNRVRVGLLLDGRPITASVPWQVLEAGDIVDAGRGLVAIDMLRHLAVPASQLSIESDYRPFDGMIFDATGLDALMAQQRGACHW